MNWNSEYVMIFFLWGIPALVFVLLLAEGKMKRILVGGILIFFGSAIYFDPPQENLSGEIAYAIWAGVGIVLTALVSYFIFKQSIDTPAIIGISFIVVGVLIMNLFSKTLSH